MNTLKRKNRKTLRTKSETEENIRLASWIVEHPFKEASSEGEKKKEWLKRLYEENGIFNKSSDARSSKETFLKNKFIKTKKWALEEGQNILQTEGINTYQDTITKLCPWFWIFNKKFDDQQYNPNDKITKHEIISNEDNNSSQESFVTENSQNDEFCSSKKRFCCHPEIIFDKPTSSNGINSSFIDSDKTLKLYTNFHQNKTNEENAIAKIKLAELEFEREKWLWNKEHENDRRKHEKEMMELKIRELQLQLEIKQAELKLKRLQEYN